MQALPGVKSPCQTVISTEREKQIGPQSNNSGSSTPRQSDRSRRLVSYTAPQDRGGAEAAKAVANALNKVALGAPLRAASRNRYAPYSTLRSVWVEMGGYDESDA